MQEGWDGAPSPSSRTEKQRQRGTGAGERGDKEVPLLLSSVPSHQLISRGPPTQGRDGRRKEGGMERGRKGKGKREGVGERSERIPASFSLFYSAVN